MVFGPRQHIKNNDDLLRPPRDGDDGDNGNVVICDGISSFDLKSDDDGRRY